ncbi:unnamed protein product [Scytosiphon promiscuus]
MVVELNVRRDRKLDLMRVGGSGCVVIKQGRDPQARAVPADAVLDVDVSLRHAEVSLGADECTGLLALSSAYAARVEQPVEVVAEEDSAPVVATKPVKPLFREDFWYFDADNNSSSSELNFDTLSGLLEQYADARARLAQSGGLGQSAFGTGSFLSLGQSDVFYDCEEGSDDGLEGGGARSDRRGTIKFRVRMTGLDVTVALAPGSMGETERHGESENCVRLHMRHMSQTLHSAGGSAQSVAEIGTFAADWNDGRGSCVRVVEVLEAAGASPAVQMSVTTGGGAEARGDKSREDVEDVRLDFVMLPLAVILDPRLVKSVSHFAAYVQTHVRPPQPVDDVDLKGEGHGRDRGVPSPSSGNVRDPCVVMTASVPKLTVRVPADPGACSSDAHAALISSVQDGTSPVGWTPRELLAGDVVPMLVLEVEGVAARLAFGSPTTQETTLQCTRVACQMLLALGDGSAGDGKVVAMGLYFLEASRSAAEVPLKVDYGLAKDIRNAGQLDLARPGDADLNFLHTWEPNDGVDSDLDDVPPAGSFGAGLQSDDCVLTEGEESSPRTLLCVLPRLAVELSRLELVVLADILTAFAAPAQDAPSATPPQDHAHPGTAPGSPVEVVVEARGATVVLHEAAAFAEDPGPHSFVLNLGNACIHVGGGSSDKTLEGNSAPLVTVSAGDVCVHETLRFSRDDRFGASAGGPVVSGPLLFLPGRDGSVHPTAEDLPAFGFVPVLYQTKWAKGTSPIAAELALGVSGPEAVFKTITATLNLYDVSLRHTVTSSWLPRLLGLVVGDVPAGRVAPPNIYPEEAFGGSVNEDGEAGGGNLTKMFITVFNGAVDYMPQSRGPGFMHKSPRTPGVAPNAQTGTTPPTEGRAVFPIGVLRVSSNMVAGAPMQGFKVVIRDIGLHMSNRVMNYGKEDAGLCCGALETRRGTPLSPANNGFSSVQEYLEASLFVQIATLNFLDAFLRTRCQVLVPSDAFTAVELWMGVVHVYTCQDSLSTCQALLGEWWALVNEVRTAEVAAAAEIGKAIRSTPKRQSGRVVQKDAQESAVTSLLDDVEQDAFLPGSNRGSPRTAERKADPGGAVSMGSTGEPGQPRKQSLVIEDYYCVSVEPPAAQAAPVPSLAESLEESPGKGAKFADPSVDQGSSFLSEGEGPAQWLAAPKADFDDGEILSMESADDTSDSEGEEDFEAKSVGLMPSQPPVARRSNFGFSLPAPIEIELEDRNDAEPPEAKESHAWEETEVPEAVASSPERREWMSEGTDLMRHGGDSLRQGEAGSSSEDVANELDYDELGVPVETPWLPASLSRGDSIPFAERAGHPTQAAGTQAGENLHYGELAAKPSAPARTGPVHREQEARWLGRDLESSSASSGLVGTGMGSSSHQPEDFRVYPHYVPIPTTAEATSLPFMSGDPLVALGKADDGGVEKGGSERVEQKLQFQLAIHDLSICWRLFKGRDWVERYAGEEDRGLHHASEKGRRQNKASSTRGPPSRAVAGGKGRRHERSRADSDGASAADGGAKPRKAELLDALLENYQDEREGAGQAQPGRRSSRQPKVKLLNLPRESGSARSGRRTGRDTSCMLEVVLQHSSIRLDSFHPGPPPSLLSNLLLSIKNLHASDTLTSNRPRKTLDHWRDDRRHPREFQQKMVTVRMTTRSPSDHFCPEDAPLGDEVMLKVRLLPIHLSFGQHTVDFLRSFSPPAKHAPSPHNEKPAGGGPKVAIEEGAGPLFISCCDVGAFKVKIDYQPRTIKVGALQNGDYMELLNLFPLEGVHLTLQKLLLTGASGWNGVAQLLLQSWVQDITSNQLHKFLAGTTAVRPLVTMGKGVADLVLLPVEQYRRDGRVLRGLRKGTQSFLRAITIETLHTSHRVASFVSRTLDDIVTQPGAQASRRGLEYYDEQPTGVIDSLEHAYDALAKEVQVAAQTIIAIPYEDQEEVVGPHGRSYVRSVARALPVAVLRPVVGASEALSCTLLGFRNYMAPVMRKEEEMRWS